VGFFQRFFSGVDVHWYFENLKLSSDHETAALTIVYSLQRYLPPVGSTTGQTVDVFLFLT
jgi:hypothetical protein